MLGRFVVARGESVAKSIDRFPDRYTLVLYELEREIRGEIPSKIFKC
jgi:hypothetical protein